MVTLYHYSGCPYCARTRIVLDEKSVEHEAVEVDLKNKPASLFLRNPKGKVPVLQDGGFVVYESNIINEYLDDYYPEPRLMPGEARGRARVRLLNDLCESELAPLVTTLAMQTKYRGPQSQLNETDVARAVSGVAEALEHIGAQLGDQIFFLGDFGLADITFAPWILWLTRLGMPRDRIPEQIVRWADRLSSRASVVRHTAEKS